MKRSFTYSRAGGLAILSGGLLHDGLELFEGEVFFTERALDFVGLGKGSGALVVGKFGTHGSAEGFGELIVDGNRVASVLPGSLVALGFGGFERLLLEVDLPGLGGEFFGLFCCFL